MSDLRNLKRLKVESLHGDAILTIGSPLSKRERFVMAAMQGLLINPDVFRAVDFKDVADGVRGGARIAKVAKVHADAALKALEGEGQHSGS